MNSADQRAVIDTALVLALGMLLMFAIATCGDVPNAAAQDSGANACNVGMREQALRPLPATVENDRHSTQRVAGPLANANQPGPRERSAGMGVEGSRSSPLGNPAERCPGSVSTAESKLNPCCRQPGETLSAPSARNGSDIDAVEQTPALVESGSSTRRTTPPKRGPNCTPNVGCKLVRVQAEVATAGETALLPLHRDVFAVSDKGSSCMASKSVERSGKSTLLVGLANTAQGECADVGRGAQSPGETEQGAQGVASSWRVKPEGAANLEAGATPLTARTSQRPAGDATPARPSLTSKAEPESAANKRSVADADRRKGMVRGAPGQRDSRPPLTAAFLSAQARESEYADQKDRRPATATMHAFGAQSAEHDGVLTGNVGARVSALRKEADLRGPSTAYGADQDASEYNVAIRIGRHHITVALTTASVCWLESGWRFSDCRAIAWTAAKRAHAPIGSGPWLSALVAYSSRAMMRDTLRARRARTLPWGDAWGAGERFNARWRALREYVAGLLERPDEHPDPCKSATHFGSVADGKRGRMQLAHCSVQTGNRFYYVGRRR